MEKVVVSAPHAWSGARPREGGKSLVTRNSFLSRDKQTPAEEKIKSKKHH